MRRFRGSRSLKRWISLGVCVVLVISCTGMAPLGFGAGSFQRRQPTSIEAEDLIGSSKASGGEVTRQEMGGFGAGWSGNAHLLWKAPKPVDTPIRNWPHLTLLFKPPAEGTYEILLHYTAAPDFGRFRVFVNGNAIGDIDGYASSVSPKSRSLGQHKLTAGSHQFIVTVFGKATIFKKLFCRLGSHRAAPLRFGFSRKLGARSSKIAGYSAAISNPWRRPAEGWRQGRSKSA